MMKDSETDSITSGSQLHSTTSGFFSKDPSSHGGSSTQTPPKRIYAAPVVAAREDAAITRSKILVALVMAVSVIAMATVIYLKVRDEEIHDFEAQFRNYASEIIAVSTQNAIATFSTIEAFAVSISSIAKATNQTWPNVTVPDFGARSTRVATSAGSIHFVWGPIVQTDEREAWEQYALANREWWFQESLDHLGFNGSVQDVLNITEPKIYRANEYWENVPETSDGPYMPIWQDQPFNPNEVWTNYNLLSFDSIKIGYETMKQTKTPTLSFTVLNEELESQMLQPIFDKIDSDDQTIVGTMWIPLSWDAYFTNLLPENANGIVVVLRSSCGESITYQINGLEAVLLGEGDVHDADYDHLKITAEFQLFEIPENANFPTEICVPRIVMDLYPSDTMKDDFTSNDAIWYTVAVVAIFLFTSAVFVLYDFFVGARQRKVMRRIINQDKIVSNIFPTAIRDRLYAHNEDSNKNSDDDLLDPLDFESSGASKTKSSPLADVFPSTTVVFADIAGFTAWSSAREPDQVFILLETLYGAFDKLTYRHGVFKVETVGDCYVAVAGLPEPNKDHAVAVCKFARDCITKMKELTLKLEVTLGPDTAELDLRVGVSSGQVTAGVLRGERSRFQLFGDTMNTAARMQSTAERNSVQLSQTTADLLVEAGFSKMLKKRNDTIFVKGKGDMQTYCLHLGVKLKKPNLSRKSLPSLQETVESSEHASDKMNESEEFGEVDVSLSNVTGMTKTERLVEWNVENLTSLLQQIIASRGGKVKTIRPLAQSEQQIGQGGATVLDEFVPIIPLKRFDATDLQNRQDPNSIDIGDEAKSQLRSFLGAVASKYNDNDFHNFEHASHVTASVKKLLKRIVNVDEGNGLQGTHDDVDLVDLAGHSYGITSDPLTQFAVVFSAIIHDLDHPGVPNTQLVKEKTRNAAIYKKSVAEQNSVDLTWEMLMSPQYEAFRACIYQTREELERFRQLVVNTVMATDIVDKELQALRKARWETAFSQSSMEGSLTESQDRKATIVIEHLIQASDVSHTMQHWHIYRTWNEKYFMECYSAYKNGRAETDPSSNWYKGEIAFFDFYVIPLAKKLDSCGVFGVSSHEYLNYATANRDEWARDGEQMVQEYLRKYNENGPHDGQA